MIELSKLGERFEDDRGVIQNLAERPVGGVAVLFCKAGSSRSHHWHRTDSHELYVVSGEMRYVERRAEPLTADGPIGPTRQTTIRPGEMVRTGPRIPHSSYFPVDTVLISLSARSRTKAEHEADLGRCDPLPWVDE